MASKQDSSAQSRNGKPRRKRGRLFGLWKSNRSPVTAITEPRITKLEQSSKTDFKPSSSKSEESRPNALPSPRSSIAAGQTQSLLPQRVKGVNHDPATDEDGSHSPSLWMRAYKALEKREPKLVAAFESYLYLARDSSAAPSQHASIPEINEAIIEKMRQDIKAKEWVVHLATKSFKVREHGLKIMEFISWTNEFISAIVSAQPYAALALSGVSVLFSLLLNSSRQKDAMLIGLKTITDLIRLYKHKEEFYLQALDQSAGKDFVNAIVSLYTNMFEYQATLILYLSRGSVQRGLQSTFERNDWGGILERVQSSDAECTQFAALFDKKEGRQFHMKELSSMEHSREFQTEVVEKLEMLYNESQQNRLEEQEAKLLKTLASDYKSDKDSIPERVPGTCEWVFEDERFLEWRENKKSSLLWISAGPGCGKSVLSRCLIDENRLRTNVMTSNVCYFFFKDGQAQRSTGSNAISAILHQLFRRKCGSSLLSHGLSSYDTFGDKLNNTFSELWDILIKSAGDPDAGEVVCVLDALDECEESARIQLVKKLVNFFSNPGHLGSSSLTLKFLITSRPYEDLERYFRPISSIDPFTRIDGDEISEKIGQEIHLVIDDKVSGIAEDFSAEERQSISGNLKGRNSRNYLWLVLITDIIEKSRSKYGKVSSINGLLSDLPSSVSDAYEKILSKSSDPESAKTLLQIVVAAQRPLNLEEANLALSIATQTASCNSHESIELWPSSSFKSTVRNMCGLFISIHDSKLFLIHQTAREFLLLPKDKQTSHPTSPGKWERSLNLTTSHGLISQICLHYLNLQDFSSVPQKPLDQSSDAQSLREKYPFLMYAAKEWPIHFDLQDSGLAQSSRQTALKLCRTSLAQLSYWSPIYGKSEELSFSDNWTELGIASHLGLVHVIDDLLNEGKDVNDVNGNAGFHGTALTVASDKGHKKVVSILLNQNADINAQSGHYGTALIAAAATGRENIVETLLERKADVNVECGHYGSALIAASAEGHEKIVEVLLNHNADVNAKCKFYGTALIAIAANGRENERIVDMLLKGRVDVEAKCGIFGTALIAAASRGHARIIKMLLSVNADINVECGLHYTALIAAAGEGHEKVVGMLLEHNANVNARFGRALAAAAAKGHKKIVEMLLTEDADVNANDIYDGTALIEASAGGYEEIVEMLLDGNADINAESENYGTALTAAAAKGHERVVEILLDRNATAGQDLTLERASAEGHERVVEVLLNRSPGIDFKSETYRNAMDKACYNLHIGSVEMLLNKMIDNNVAVETYGTSLELALDATAEADEEKAEKQSENEERKRSIKNRDMMIEMLHERKRQLSAQKS